MRSLSLSLAAACLCLAPSLVSADDTYTYTLHSTYQAVTSTGAAAWPGTGNSPYKTAMVGVVINNPDDMLNSSNTASSPQWQVFIQAINPNNYGVSVSNWSDFGGTALYMTKYYTDYSTSPPTKNTLYDNAAWTSEMTRLNNPYDYTGRSSIDCTTAIDTTASKVTTSLKYGDVVMVQANAPGLFYGGKYNINEQHDNASSLDFNIAVLSRDAAPDVITTNTSGNTLTLADFKDSSDKFIFDSTRATGCEHYQASLVHLDNLRLSASTTSLVDNKTVTVEQNGLTFNLLLGLTAATDLANRSITVSDLINNPFSVTAIFDQEGGSAVMSGYRLWLTDASGLTVVPEPNSLILLVVGLLSLAAYAWRKKK